MFFSYDAIFEKTLFSSEISQSECIPILDFQISVNGFIFNMKSFISDQRFSSTTDGKSFGLAPEMDLQFELLITNQDSLSKCWFESC